MTKKISQQKSSENIWKLTKIREFLYYLKQDIIMFTIFGEVKLGYYFEKERREKICAKEKEALPQAG